MYTRWELYKCGMSCIVSMCFVFQLGNIQERILVTGLYSLQWNTQRSNTWDPLCKYYVLLLQSSHFKNTIYICLYCVLMYCEIFWFILLLLPSKLWKDVMRLINIYDAFIFISQKLFKTFGDVIKWHDQLPCYPCSCNLQENNFNYELFPSKILFDFIICCISFYYLTTHSTHFC